MKRGGGGLVAIHRDCGSSVAMGGGGGGYGRMVFPLKKISPPPSLAKRYSLGSL